MNMNASSRTGSVCIVAVSLVLVVVGCSTGVTPMAQTNARIKEKAAAFATLTEAQKNNIRGGAIEVGDSPDAVYMALGRPTNIVTSADGQKAMWRYLEYTNMSPTSKLSLTNMNTSRRYKMAMTAPQAPGPSTGAGAPEKFGFGAGSLSTMTELPDLQSTTVYVFFYQNKVLGIKTDRPDLQEGKATTSM